MEGQWWGLETGLDIELKKTGSKWEMGEFFFFQIYNGLREIDISNRVELVFLSTIRHNSPPPKVPASAP